MTRLSIMFICMENRIVSLRSAGAAGCRKLLLQAGTGIINLNDIRNGVPLPKDLRVRVPGYATSVVHSVTHTAAYYRELENRLRAVAPGKLVQVLSRAANELLLGTFPH